MTWRVDCAALRAREYAPGLSRSIAHRADAEFPFLHDTMMVGFEGRLLMAWYNCTEDEIAGRTVIRGRWSQDGGSTWFAPEVLCEDESGQRHMVPVTFTAAAGSLFGYVTEMTAHDVPTGYAVIRRTGGGWQRECMRGDRALINTIPVLWRGMWVAGGRVSAAEGALPLIPAIMCAGPQQPAEWRICALPGPWNGGEYPLRYPETAVLPCEDAVEAIVRNDDGPAQLFRGDPRTGEWARMGDCPLPVGAAKVCAGALPDGRQYLIYNEAMPDGARSRLVISLRDGENAPFDRTWLLADGYDATIDGGPYWHYPCACLLGDRLLVSCSSSGEGIVRHAALIEMDIAGL